MRITFGHRGFCMKKRMSNGDETKIDLTADLCVALMSSSWPYRPDDPDQQDGADEAGIR